MMPTRPRNVSCPSSGPEAKASTAERADPRKCHWGRGTDASRSPPWPHDVAVPPGGEGLGHRVPGPRKGRRRSVRWSQACPGERASPQTEVLETASLAPNEAAVQGATNPTHPNKSAARRSARRPAILWVLLVCSRFVTPADGTAAPKVGGNVREANTGERTLVSVAQKPGPAPRRVLRGGWPLTDNGGGCGPKPPAAPP